MEAQHWSAQYVGQPYIPGENDCASFAERVQRERFGRTVRLPSDRAPSLRGRTRQIEARTDDVAARVDTPEEGDGVLMGCRGSLSHIGVYCEIDGTPYVLHAVSNMGQVVLHRIVDLWRIGLRVEGYYRWK